MRVWHDIAGWRVRRDELSGRTIGFVPTMGALHRGHASLVERCRRENDIVVASIFVNPSQFNDARDLERYPRTLDEDLAILRSLCADEVIVPSAADMYPRGYRFHIEPDCFSLVMEGVHRPGFLQGVLTVVLKLLNLVRPQRAYFGEKDYQQLQAVADLAQEFFLATEIVACPTVREESGLALSSRNQLLSEAGREKAAGLYRALTTTANSSEARATLQAEGFLVDYVEEHLGRRFAAALLEGVRLIDNVALPEQIQ
jgi:pantoate--beta-alanine ligase